ncbi:MAG: universal stress protein [Desulfobacteraceae bacterium]|nr:universal stress protein [Desulfobacteraceae bacterium]
MRNKGRILFPVDLTESSEALVPHAKVMAEKFEANLHILFVVRIFHYFSSIYVPHPSISMFEGELLDGARKKMQEFQKSNFQDQPNVFVDVVLGDPADTIIFYIKQHQIDLVIMGTHGRKGLDRVIFGSVAERVIKTSSAPVLVVNPFMPASKDK